MLISLLHTIVLKLTLLFSIIQTIENLKQELESAKDLQLKVNLANDLQQENEKLNQTISELNQKLENQTTESIATIQVSQFLIILFPYFLFYRI